ncbi:MAG: CPBP family intramembrane glutamic endopeptidase [Promethearchaeota archaeon]
MEKNSNEFKQMFDKNGRIVLISVCLLTVSYWFLALWYTNKSGYTKELVIFYAIFGPIFNYHPWLDFWQYIYQFIMTVIFFFIIPVLMVKYYFKEDYKDYGLKLGKKKAGLILMAIGVILVFLLALSTCQDPVLNSEYPLSKLIGTSWVVFIFYEAVYFFYFFAYEYMMRGYLQWGLKREGATFKGILLILAIQTIITTLFHIGKPMPEIIAALAIGPIFGYLCLKLDSIWYVIIVHFILNVFQDLFILNYLGMLPN